MRRLLRLAVVISTVLAFSPGAEAQVYIAYREAGIVNRTRADTGALITERFIHGLTEPRAICLDHGVLYVLQQSGVVGKYDAGSRSHQRPLHLGLQHATGDGRQRRRRHGQLLVAFQHLGQGDNLVGKFDASTGATINASS